MYENQSMKDGGKYISMLLRYFCILPKVMLTLTEAECDKKNVENPRTAIKNEM